jgi:hypothetical protein
MTALMMAAASARFVGRESVEKNTGQQPAP